MKNMKNREEIKSLITQRRKQMLVHSYIYYGLGTSIVDDATWDRWARELVQLQKQYPEIAKECIHAKEFEDFDATTGYHLPIYQLWIAHAARRLLDYEKKKEGMI